MNNYPPDSLKILRIPAIQTQIHKLTMFVRVNLFDFFMFFEVQIIQYLHFFNIKNRFLTDNGSDPSSVEIFYLKENITDFLRYQMTNNATGT
jgi:hypothetical protein